MRTGCLPETWTSLMVNVVSGAMVLPQTRRSVRAIRSGDMFFTTMKRADSGISSR
ncbi:hypothetical protein D3C71_2222430 [compost metagenome]